ncbi:proprotein convertase subtilisin/kexin type 5-like [Mya arenaria]|uniref:proprotein convertase subtilisin/kexin type 5-like n=1 Tax=Mya arenaria TaxID=6604 RepID=UPI0022E816D6|nr:proprotein convertase subtilisin/kexin type 5-like [Mya arenaria]
MFYVDNNACCECPENCKNGTCKGGPECISGCIDGFYGMDCSQSCLSLSTDCLRCTQIHGKCLECNNGFYLNDNGSCISCSSSCKGGICNCAKVNGCINDLEGRYCSEQRIDIGSSTIRALSALSVVLGLSLICTAAGCYMWNRRRSKPTAQDDQSETVMSYEQLQGQTNEPTYTNADESYSVLSV